MLSRMAGSRGPAGGCDRGRVGVAGLGPMQRRADLQSACLGAAVAGAGVAAEPGECWLDVLDEARFEGLEFR